MPQLDALRAFAVGGVLIHHFVGVEHLPSFLKEVPFGFLGVRLFFVLSGFLITGILLKSRDRVDSGRIGKVFAVRQFYARRILRIFPLYYAVVALSWIFDLPPTREVIGWLLTYTYNIQLSFQGWFPEHLSHFWTLSVEEQYYLFWPGLVLFAPRRTMPLLIALIILVGPAFRFLAVVNEWNEVATYCMTFSNLDTLGMGSLLALLARSRMLGKERLHSILRYALWIGMATSIFLNFLFYSGIDPRLLVVFLDTSVGLVFTWLVYTASYGFRGMMGRLLELKPLVYCGKITYGIYVYHLFVPYLLSHACTAMGLEYPAWGGVNLIVGSAVTIAVASLSWYVMEQPLNNLKRHFSYG